MDANDITISIMDTKWVYVGFFFVDFEMEQNQRVESSNISDMQLWLDSRLENHAQILGYYYIHKYKIIVVLSDVGNNNTIYWL